MYRLHLYKDRQRQWRWRLLGRNGRTVACSGEGYRRRIDCARMARKILGPLVSEA